MRRAIEDAEHLPCFWLGGLMPGSWTRGGPSTDEDNPTFFGQAVTDTGDYAGWIPGGGDASGGVSTADPRTWRVGWATVFFNGASDIQHASLQGGLGGPLPRRRQTVNKG